MLDKSLFDKPKADWTEEEKDQVTKAIDSYQKAIIEVCKEHGLQHSVALEYSPSGIRPAFQIVPFTESNEA